MIDIYNEVYTNIKNTLSDVNVLPNYPSGVPVFPCLVFEETSNTTNQNTIDTNGEKYSDVIFEINIFTNTETKVSDAREIRNRVDNIMNGLYGMTRTFGQPVPNFLDTNVHRYILRYNSTVGQDKKIYRG